MLSNYQHGFRKNRSTTGAIYQLLERININMDKRTPTLVTYIVFKKAFDCVQFDILLGKVDKLGLNKNFVVWIKDYLSHRKQRVIANGFKSDILDIRQGVPQGSILGPLLYLIYANDIQQIIHRCGFSFYADDTVLYSVHHNFLLAKRNMQKNLNNLNNWCQYNGIFMNVNKTKYMIFGSKHTLAKVKNFELKVNKKNLERVLSYNYLGVMLDPSLTFEKHVTRLIGRVADKIKQLQKMRFFMNVKAATLIYKNMVLPILEYGDIFLSAASKINRKRLQILQNRALRIANGVDRDTEIEDLHTQSKLMKLKTRRRQHLLQFIYNYTHIQASENKFVFKNKLLKLIAKKNT